MPKLFYQPPVYLTNWLRLSVFPIKSLPFRFAYLLTPKVCSPLPTTAACTFLPPLIPIPPWSDTYIAPGRSSLSLDTSRNHRRTVRTAHYIPRNITQQKSTQRILFSAPSLQPGSGAPDNHMGGQAPNKLVRFSSLEERVAGLGFFAQYTLSTQNSACYIAGAQ